MGWFSRKPEIEVGDTVWDGYFANIGEPRKKSEVIRIERRGVFASEEYYLRESNSSFESSYPRRRKHLELIPKEKPKAIDLRSQPRYAPGEVMEIQKRQIENQRRISEALAKMEAERAPRRSSWYDVIAKDNMRYTNYARSGTLEVKEGDMVRMRALSDGTYELNLEGEVVRLSKKDGYEVCNIRRKTKEEKDMGGELFGYPPEEEREAEQRAHEYAVRLAKQNAELAEERARVKELKTQLEEQERKNEVVRRQEVADTYGIVAERHLWSVTVDVPMQWSGPIPKRGCEEKTEVLTEGRNMVEAAMAAEAMAKGIAEDAHVLSIDYVRVIGALK